MTKILLIGCSGRMGSTILRCCNEKNEYCVVAGIDEQSVGSDIPVYRSPFDCKENFDVILDFSHPSVTEVVAEYITANPVPAVICTTGLSAELTRRFAECSQTSPVFMSANMSFGVNVVCELVKQAARILCDYDIEIVEKHHNKKIDAPSGTAIMLANAIDEEYDMPRNYVYERHSVRRPRENNEIGIHSIRGGTIAGEHEILFCGEQEVISIKHEAFSREIFAKGALRACSFIVGKQRGFYSMADMITEVME